MASAISNFFFQIDLFKSPIFFFVNNKQQNSTLVGSFLSLLIIFYLGMSFIHSDVFYKTRPTIIDQTQVLTHRPAISLNSSNFALSMSVVDSNSIPYNDPTVASIALVNKIINGPNITYDFRSLHPCNDSDFPTDPNVINNLRLRNTLCMDDPHIDLKGYWDEETISYIMIALLVCQNGSDTNITCKSEEDISKNLKEKYFQIYYKENNYDMSNLENPTNSIFKTNYALIDPKLRKKLNIYFKKMEITDDKGLVLDETHSTDSFKKDSETWDMDSNSEGDQIIFVICLYSSEYQQLVIRRYQKLQEAIASLGGSASILIMIGFILTKTQNKLNLANVIMNHLYNFQPLETKQKKKKKGKKSKKNSQNPANQQEKFNPLWSPSLSPSNKNKFRENTKEMGFTPPPKKLALVKLKDFTYEVNRRRDSISTTTFIQHMASPKCEINDKILVKVPAKNDLNDSFILENFSQKKITDAAPTSQFPLGMKTQKTSQEMTNSICSPKLNANMMKRITSKIFGETSYFKRSSTTLNEYAMTVQKESKITIKIWEYFKLKLKRLLKFQLDPKENLLYIAEKIFKRELDVINILKRLQDVEKLKMILLNENQLSLFELLAKPMIYLEGDEKNQEPEEKKMLSRFDSTIVDNKLMARKKEEEKIKNIKKILYSYKKTVRSENLTEIDQRLLKLVDKNLKDFCLHYGSAQNIL